MEQERAFPSDFSMTVWQAFCKLLQDALVPVLLRDAQKTQLMTGFDRKVSTMLLALGIPPKLKGYSFLREAIRLYAEDPDQMITKELYCAVAANCDATPAQVERGIRTAIGIGWERGDPFCWRQYFPQCRGCADSRPSNGTFISRLAAEMNAGNANG